jgi:integrase
VGYAAGVQSSFNVIEELMSPDKLTRITERWLGRLHSLAKKRIVARTGQPISQMTLKKYFQHLLTALKWAVEQKYIKEVPTFPKEARQNRRTRTRLMKGRPLTGEEFDRLLVNVQKTFLKPRKPTPEKTAAIRRGVDSLKYLLDGLWLSGLRIGEAIKLTWDQWGDGIRVNVDGDGDVWLMIDSEDQKNRQSMVYPVVDDFAEFLLQTPPEDRHGFVFNPCRMTGKVCRRPDTVSGWIVDIGEKASIKVNTTNGVDKFASAHDLRRAFGTRWAKIVPPMILKGLMRHSDIQTTMKFYVEIEAKETIEEVRRHLKKHLKGDTSGDTSTEKDPEHV